MILAEASSRSTQKYFYLSKQHGALITIIICNIIALMASENWHLYQIFTLIFGISLFHISEFISLPKREKKRLIFGFYFYCFLATLSALIFLPFHNHLTTMAALGIPISIIFFMSQRYCKNSPVTHLSAFALLILSGLLTQYTLNSLSIIHLFSQLFIYFSCSVLLINWKMGKINLTWLTVFTFFATALLFFLHEPTLTIYLLLIIINCKLLFTITFKTMILKAKMKSIGYLETLACIALIYIL